MKKYTLLLIALLLSNQAQADCFIALENGKILYQEGECKTRHSPCSSFKIPLALMGYDLGILVDETNPQWNFEKGFVDDSKEWTRPHNPESWIKYSVVWYSQELTKKMGIEKFQKYVDAFDYGNKDLSGDKGSNNGLTQSWLVSSLQISPVEQVKFMEKFLAKKLPVSEKSFEMTRNILFIEDLENGWKFYGKTGTGNPQNKSGEKDKTKSQGWFLGFIEKGERKIAVVNYIVEDSKSDSMSGKRSKMQAKEIIMNKFVKN